MHMHTFASWRLSAGRLGTLEALAVESGEQTMVVKQREYNNNCDTFISLANSEANEC